MKVLVCDKFHDEGIKLLKEAGLEVDVKLDMDLAELKREIGKHEGIIVRSRTKITKETLQEASQTKIIARAGVGLDNIDVESAERCGIKVVNTAEAPTHSVAELTIGLIFAVVRTIPNADKTLKTGKWLKSKFTGHQLKGKTLGILGFGRIGSKVAKIGKALGMDILVSDIVVNDSLLKEVEGRSVSIEELLSKSDVVTIHMPLTQRTEGMIDGEKLSLMKKDAVIVNTARGPIINEEALHETLKEGKILGAALDVFTEEPPRDFKLIQLPNVISTPHIAAQTVEAQRETGILTANKIIDFLIPSRQGEAKEIAK